MRDVHGACEKISGDSVMTPTKERDKWYSGVVPPVWNSGRSRVWVGVVTAASTPRLGLREPETRRCKATYP